MCLIESELNTVDIPNFDPNKLAIELLPVPPLYFY